jgi:hypothetical protein
MGFLLNIIPHILVVVLYGPDLEGDLPPWFCIFIGVTFFLYMLCDNSDGK